MIDHRVQNVKMVGRNGLTGPMSQSADMFDKMDNKRRNHHTPWMLGRRAAKAKVKPVTEDVEQEVDDGSPDSADKSASCGSDRDHAEFTGNSNFDGRVSYQLGKRAVQQAVSDVSTRFNLNCWFARKLEKSAETAADLLSAEHSNSIKRIPGAPIDTEAQFRAVVPKAQQARWDAAQKANPYSASGTNSFNGQTGWRGQANTMYNSFAAPIAGALINAPARLYRRGAMALGYKPNERLNMLSTSLGDAVDAIPGTEKQKAWRQAARYSGHAANIMGQVALGGALGSIVGSASPVLGGATRMAVGGLLPKAMTPAVAEGAGLAARTFLPGWGGRLLANVGLNVARDKTLDMLPTQAPDLDNVYNEAGVR